MSYVDPSLGHATRLTPAQTPGASCVKKFILQNEAYPDFDIGRDWLILFSPNLSLSETRRSLM